MEKTHLKRNEGRDDGNAANGDSHLVATTTTVAATERATGEVLVLMQQL